jgi:HMG (high mobility group) box/HMG-box domain
MVSDAWRNMDAEERDKYEELARRDKERYNIEKASYIPPPGHGSSSKRRRDPDAPKRPMSAYLAFANKRRAEVKAQNPDCSNGEISKILSTMWKDSPDETKQGYKDAEHALWDSYKAGMVEWRKKNDGRKKSAKRAALRDASLSYDAAAGGKSKRAKKTKAKASSIDDFGGREDHDGGPFVDDHQLGLGGPAGFMYGSGNPNPEEMMAASALRGVRGGPAQPLLMTGHGAMGDFGNQFQPQSAGSGGYGAFLGMNGVNNMSAMNPMMGGGAPGNGGNFGQLDIAGFPYNQYGGYSLGGNPQAMLMAQLRGAAPNPYQQYPGFLCELTTLCWSCM